MQIANAYCISELKNSSSLKKLTIETAHPICIIVKNLLRRIPFAPPRAEPFPQVIIINDDIEHYIPFLIENTAFYVDIDARIKKRFILPIFFSKYRASILNNTFDSLCAVYKTPKTYSDSIVNLMRDSSFKQAFQERSRIRILFMTNLNLNSIPAGQFHFLQ